MFGKLKLASALVLALSAPAFAADAPGVNATEIKIGGVFPFSGPASSIGLVGKGVLAYVQSINDRGGINGRRINYIAMDDAYSPPKAVEHVRKLVESDEVAFIFSQLVTPAYEITDPTVDSQVVTLKSSGAKALLVAGTPKFSAQAIRKVAEIGWKPTLIVNFPSSSVSATLKPAGLDNAVGVIVGTFNKD